MVAEDFSAFASAILSKLIREVGGTPTPTETRFARAR
jgi:hypothetical protein